MVTFVALVAIIALAAGGLIVVMLAIMHVEGEQKLERRPASRGIAQAWTSWRHRRAYFRARSRRRALYTERAGWLAAAVASSVVLAYLIVHV